jgi:hypothetical protein
MPKPAKPTSGDAWQFVDYQTWTNYGPAGTGLEGTADNNQFSINSDGTWDEFTEIVNADGTLTNTSEHGTLRPKELKQLDALMDAITAEDDYGQEMQFTNDEPFGSPVERVYLYNTTDMNQLVVVLDDPQNNQETYAGNDQTDVQEAQALQNYLAYLDARYGDNLA